MGPVRLISLWSPPLSWDSELMPSLLKPGHDAPLPSTFAAWRRGVTYTVRPEMLAPLVRGKVYRIDVTVRRKVAPVSPFTGYCELYHGCQRIFEQRLRQIACEDAGRALHTWRDWQAWWIGNVADKYPCAGDHSVACASIRMGLLFPGGTDGLPAGLSEPEASALLQPVADLTVPNERPQESYVDYDFSGALPDISLSYGEYLPEGGEVDFEPIVRRAERLASSYAALQSPQRSIEIVRREWLCIRESDLALAMISFRLGER